MILDNLGLKITHPITGDNMITKHLFCRIYATKFLGVLLRSKANNVAHWGLELITGQLFDQNSKIVPIVALNILDEAADDKMNLEAMVCALQNKDLGHLGTRGELLKTRLLVSSTYGVKVRITVESRFKGKFCPLNRVPLEF